MGTRFIGLAGLRGLWPSFSEGRVLDEMMSVGVILGQVSRRDKCPTLKMFR